MDKQIENIVEGEEPKRPRFPWWIAIVVVLLWCLNLWWGIWAMDNDPSKGGQWGDIFGAVNALFSAGSVLLIYHGIRMQRYEVELAKAELDESKKQTLAQKGALDKQNEATERQMFESTFFKLWENTINEYRSAIAPDGRFEGVRAFTHFANEISHCHDSYIEKLDGDQNYCLETEPGNESYVESFHLTFSGYFGATESLLVFLRDNFGSSTTYAKLVSTRLSEPEIMILAFAPLISVEFRGLGALMKRFSLLRNLKSYDGANLLIAKIFASLYSNNSMP